MFPVALIALSLTVYCLTLWLRQSSPRWAMAQYYAASIVAGAFIIQAGWNLHDARNYGGVYWAIPFLRILGAMVDIVIAAVYWWLLRPLAIREFQRRLYRQQSPGEGR